MIKWSVELGEFDLGFCPWQAIKSQILTDFVSEWTETRQSPLAEKLEHYKMCFDGSLNLEGAGAGILFISPPDYHLKYVLQIHYKAFSNDAEYEALIHRLRIIVSFGIKRLSLRRLQGHHRPSQQGLRHQEGLDECLVH
jgi:hypothetical protein